MAMRIETNTTDWQAAKFVNASAGCTNLAWMRRPRGTFRCLLWHRFHFWFFFLGAVASATRYRLTCINAIEPALNPGNGKMMAVTLSVMRLTSSDRELILKRWRSCYH